jgi:hypothetical protein
MRYTQLYYDVYNLAKQELGRSALLIKQGCYKLKSNNYRLEILNSDKVNEHHQLDTTILKIGSLRDIESFLEGVRYAQAQGVFKNVCTR